MSEQTRWLSADEQQSWRAYLRASRQLWVALDRDLHRSHGLSLAEYEILSMLSEADDRRLRMSALAEIVVQSRSRVTHTANRLERRGLVERTPVTDDRRGIDLSLTDAGLELLVDASRVHVQGVRSYLIDILDPGTFTAMGQASEKMSDAIAADDRTPAGEAR